MYFETPHKVAGQQPWSFCGAMIYALESLHQHVTLSLCIIPFAIPSHSQQNYNIPFHTLFLYQARQQLFVVSRL